MQNVLKRVIAIVMVAIFCMSAGVVNVLAEELTKPTLQVENVSAMPGSTVKVKIDLKNNPGLASLKFNVNYDDVLTLTNVEFNSEFGTYVTAPTPYKNPQTISMISPLADVSVSGNFCTLTFTVSKEAEDNYYANVSISYDPDDVFNADYDGVDISVIGGSVRVCSGIPGDINGDKKVNNKDAMILFRYIAGWDVEVDLGAVDCNGDGSVNTKDAITLFRYCAGWPDIVLVYPGVICSHELTAIARKEATCEEDGNIAYWHCSKCGRYFSNENGTNAIALVNTVIPAKGHTVVIDPAVPATETSTGLTEGSHCSVCKKILVVQEVIPIIVPERYAITYNISNGDTYIASQDIENSNPEYYTSKGLTLKTVSCPGYNFLGWYDLPSGENAEIVKSIAPETTGEIELYAHWEKIPYSVAFSSNLVNAEKMTYTVDEGAILPTLSLDGYIFAGWSDDAGNIWQSIPAGTIGNKTYTANWTSERNQAWSKSKIDKPIIIEDDETNTILFTYEVGEIRNVPVYVIEDFGKINSNGVSKTVTKTFTTKTSQTLMDTYTKTVSDATTNSFGWTLSNDWSDSTTINEEWCKQNGMTVEEAEKYCKSDTSGWYVSKGSSGSKTTQELDTSDEYDLNTSTHNSSLGLAASRSASLTDTSSVKASIGSEISAKYAGVGGKISGNLETSDSFSSNTTNTDSSSFNLSGGKSDQGGTIKHKGTNTTSNSSWNSESGYNGSSTTSSSASVSKVVSESISNRYGYGKTYIIGGGEESTQGTTNSSSESNSYASTVTYSTEESESQTLSYTTTNTVSGYHRWTMAGTAHVFAVVGYDIESDSYFVTTYTVMDDHTYQFEDYSYLTPNYNDNQNTLIDFEVPYDTIVSYVGNRVGESEGLEVSADGRITAYKGTDDYVVIPEYKVIDNLDGTSQVIKITGLSSTAFKDNKNITGIVLSEFIDEIPANAFENCSSLVEVGSYATKIGDSAFLGCTSMPDVMVGHGITSVCANSFGSAENLTVYAANKDVVDAAVSSTADNITVYITDACDSLDNKNLNISSEVNNFTFNGLGKEYNNFIINSDAQNTTISRATFSSTGKPPLSLSSGNVMLNQVTVLSSGIGLVLTAENCNLSLYGVVSVNSNLENAMLCRHVDLSKKDDKFYSLLVVNGNMLVREDDVSYLKDSTYLDCSGEIKSISEDMYQKYLAGEFKITLDTNCDNDSSVFIENDSIMAYYNCEIGTLPTLTRDYYVFNGWYTEKDGGTQVTSSTSFDTVENRTIYAHWTQNGVSGWVEASSAPSDAQIINSKWTYTLRNYTSSSSSSLSGWTKYDTKRTSWGATQGPVYSNPSNGSRNVWSEQYVSSSKTIYKYYHTYNGSIWGNDKSAPNAPESMHHRIELDYQLSYKSTGSTGIKWHGSYECPKCKAKNMWCPDGSYVKETKSTRWYYQDPVYTYYYYKDEAKETTSGDPTGQTNVSNVVKYVQYRAK